MTEHRISLDDVARARDGTGHSIFSASSSHMWLNCSGSLIPNVLSSDDGSFDAAWGTVAHEVSERWLKARKRPNDMLGKLVWVPGGEWGYGIDIDETMMHFVEESVSRCLMQPGEHIIELGVDYSDLTPIDFQGGTLDFAALTPGRADLTDHKYGSSPENIVMAEENTQLMLYALGLNRKFGLKYRFQEYILRINQPRLNHFDEWVCSKKRLIEFAAYVRERAKVAWVHDAPRTPGAKQCRFCMVKADCTANGAYQVDLFAGVFEDTTKTAEQMEEFKAKVDDEFFELVPSKVNTMSTDLLAKLLPFRSMAEKWWASLDEELERRALDGKKVNGYKLVLSRSHRKFKNQPEARDKLIALGLAENDVVKKTLVSPAQAEELLMSKLGMKKPEANEAIVEWYTKPPGKPTLVPAHDKRDAIVDLTSGVFSDETQAKPEDEEL